MQHEPGTNIGSGDLEQSVASSLGKLSLFDCCVSYSYSNEYKFGADLLGRTDGRLRVHNVAVSGHIRRSGATEEGRQPSRGELQLIFS